MPKYAKFSVKDMHSKLNNLPDVAIHMPDFKEDKLPEKEYWIRVICSLYPEEIFNLIQTAQSNRGISHASKKDEMIEITPGIKEEINKLVSMPKK